MTTTSSDKTLHIDIETYSDIDIKCGVYKYAGSEDFQVLLLAYAFDDDPVRIIDLAQDEPLPGFLIDALTDPHVTKIAHNANFERTCLARYLGKPMPPEQWRCSMVQAYYCGLPGSLKAVGEALDIDQKKMASAGTRLINYWCKPNENGDRREPFWNIQDWDLFKEYCKRDVEAEREIYDRLLQIQPVPPREWRLWCLDQKINDLGIEIDEELVDAVLDLWEAWQENLLARLKQLAPDLNPRSNTQFLSLLKAKGLDLPNLQSATVDQALKDSEEGSEIHDLLYIRRELTRTALAKYGVFQKATSNGRIRGILQFYGAHTGRWSGRLVQPQNLPRPRYYNYDHIQELIRCHDLETLSVDYDSVADALSSVIRTVITSDAGLSVADYSAIECRVIAWLADEMWVLEAFDQGKDIYCETASQMFGVPVEKHGENSHLRSKGKIATLACIAEDQLVLTDQELVPIQDVTTDMKVWDGEEWVSHDGVVYKGEKEVIEYEGLIATEDHQVYVEGYDQPMRFGTAARRRLRLRQTGDRGTALWKSPNQSSSCDLYKTKKKRLVRSICPGSLHRMPSRTLDQFQQPETWNYKRLRPLRTKGKAVRISKMASQKVSVRKRPLSKSECRRISQLRKARNRIPLLQCDRSMPVHGRNLWPAESFHGNRQDRQRRPLRARESKMGDQRRKFRKPKNYRSVHMERRRLALCSIDGNQETRFWNEPRRNHRRSQRRSIYEAKKLAGDSKKVAVYDILNAGPRNRFTVSGKLVHNCGYQGSVGALKAFGADRMGMSEQEMKDTVRKWRDANPRICRLWAKTEDAAINALKYRRSFEVAHGVSFDSDGKILFCQLPTGRSLIYPKARVRDGSFAWMEGSASEGKDSVEIFSNGHWNRTWGGRLVENIVQAIARDCLASALLRLDREGFRIVAHVHDEVIVEGDGLERICEIMGQELPWAKGLHLRAEGFTSPYYRKD